MEPVILLLEDSENDAILLQYAFRKAGLACPLQVVRDGLDAQAYLMGLGGFADREKHPTPNLLVLDLSTPRGNGMELLCWLRTQPALHTLTKVVLTGSAQQAQINAAYAMGANSFLIKPTNTIQLQRMVDSFYQYWIVHNHLPDPPGKLEFPQHRMASLSPRHSQISS